MEKLLNLQAARLLKAELKVKGLTYADLANLLTKSGFKITEAAVRNRLHRGTLSASFYLGSLASIGLDNEEAAAFLTRVYAPMRKRT